MLDKYKVLRNAEKLVIERKFVQAIREYEKLKSEDGNDPTLLNTIGDLMVRVHEIPKALQHFHKVAQIYLDSGFVVRAIATFKKIHHLDPDDLKVNESLAELFLRQGLKQDSKKHLFFVYRHYRQAGDALRASEALERLVKVDPSNIDNRLELAALQAEKGNAESSLENRAQAVELLLEAKETDRAFEAARQGLAIEDGQRGFVKAYVTAAEAAGHLDEAVAYLRRRREETGVDVPYGILLATSLEKMGQKDEARKLYLHLVEEGHLDPTLSEGLSRLEVGRVPRQPRKAPLRTAEEPAEGLTAPAEAAPSAAEPDKPAPRPEDEPAETPETSQIESPADVPEGSGLFDFDAGQSFDVDTAEWRGEEEDEADFTFEPAESDAGEADETPLGSGLFGLEETDEDQAPAAAASREKALPAASIPLAPPPDSKDISVGSLDEAIEEADFYLKLGFQEEARRVLEVLLRDYPQDERVLRRAKKVMLTLPPPPPPAAGEGAGDEAEGEAATDFFDDEIDTALDALFTGADDEAPDEFLRYDVQKSSVAQAENPKVHYDLGLAYKEMGLIEDAVAEFIAAMKLLKAPDHNPQRILCCSTLANSYLQLSNFDEAVRWAREGLGIPDMKDFEWKALQYDLGCALLGRGDEEEALARFRSIAKKEKDYRDVSQRIAQL